MKKNIMLPIAATFIAAVSLPTVFAQPEEIAQSELLFSYENLSDELVYVAIKGDFSYGEYATINDVGWVTPQTSGEVYSDAPWVLEQQIDKNSFVSLAFLTKDNQIITCKEDFYLDKPTKISLKRDANDILECTATDESTDPQRPPIKPTPKPEYMSYRFKEISQFNSSRYALFFYDPADDKWKNLSLTIANNARPGKMVLDTKGEGEWWVMKDIQPHYLSPAFSYDSMVMLAVRENSNQDEEYNARLPLAICGEVKFSGSYDFIFYEEGQRGVLHGCSANIN
ncbi:MAG: hypothetical protein ACRC7P_02360 [Enterovibrio sp.]